MRDGLHDALLSPLASACFPGRRRRGMRFSRGCDLSSREPRRRMRRTWARDALRGGNFSASYACIAGSILCEVTNLSALKCEVPDSSRRVGCSSGRSGSSEPAHNNNNNNLFRHYFTARDPPCLAGCMKCVDVFLVEDGFCCAFYIVYPSPSTCVPALRVHPRSSPPAPVLKTTVIDRTLARTEESALQV